MNDADVKIYEALRLLSEVDNLPYRYVQRLGSDIALMRRPRVNRPTFCYLGFFGHHASAFYLKVGYSQTPHSRLASFSTGNPMRPLDGYQAEFPTVWEARLIEQTVQRFLKPRHVEGEWFSLGGMLANARYDLVKEIEAHTGIDFREIRDGDE